MSSWPCALALVLIAVTATLAARHTHHTDTDMIKEQQPMAITTLFTRRPKPVDTPAYEPEPRPEIGETWTPAGVTVIQRYANQAGAVVLVYTAAVNYEHTVACLGCHFVKNRTPTHSYPWFDLDDAAKTANEHATTCRALPRDIPDRPDDTAARDQLRKWVSGCRRQSEDVQLWISGLDLIRLTLQRSDDWIEIALQQLADEQPDLLIAKRSEYSDGTQFYARRNPAN